ncbi:MAG: hypothetical protein KTR15_06810 [Phycisphaeraceae bacterium]|nr:hypothetical protein [Phycisphaeraceae bacterium]
MKRTLGLLTLSLVLLQGATGCNYSEDREVYKSTYMSPKSVYAVYKPSNETAWSYEIPPQHILVVERDAEDSGLEWARSPEGYPTSLSWELYPITATKSLLRNNHYSSIPIESGVIELNGTPMIIGSTVGKPIDPATVPTERAIEDIEKDLPEPDALPEPTEEAAEDAAE